MKQLLLGLCFLLSALSAPAALEKDLGSGLWYLRTTDLKKDEPQVEAALLRPALVLDLRTTRADADSAQALQAALEHASTDHHLHFILINATTTPALVAAVSAGYPEAVTFGPRSPAIVPDVPIAISDEKDRLAYEALNKGTPIEKLIQYAPEKRRYDEAALARDRARAQNPDAADEDAADADTAVENGATKAEAKKPEPPPLIDAVLQRAVQLHRSLAALKKG